jgi:hypothetical protein
MGLLVWRFQYNVGSAFVKPVREIRLCYVSLVLLVRDPVVPAQPLAMFYLVAEKVATCFRLGLRGCRDSDRLLDR